jgi:hypothetical protein
MTFRIDIIEEDSGTVVQSVRGIPERKMMLILSMLGAVGNFLREMRPVREAIRAAMERR